MGTRRNINGRKYLQLLLIDNCVPFFIFFYTARRCFVETQIPVSNLNNTDMRSAILPLLSLLASVSAHGYVDNVTIAGVTYTGYQV